jgi:hypothetical protein
MKNNKISKLNSSEVILHGECLLFASKLPKNGLKKRKPKNGYIVVAASETTGNDHVVDVIDGVDFYENDKGVLFMESSVETSIRCLHKDRHDTITLPAGTYEFGTQQEYDPFLARMQSVRD